MDKKYDHITTEQEIQHFWQEQKTYAFEIKRGPLYNIDTPPPTVSGSLHIGHIFSYTQTDIIARYKRLKGFAVFYPFGFDDNGLPTERFVEKRLNVAAYKMARSSFIDLCLQETEKVELEFKKLWQAIGLSADWSLWYSTINILSRTLAQKSFLDLYKKGFIYRKKQPALFCTTCRTSVAQAELDDVEKQSIFYDIAFEIIDKNDKHFTDAMIATTRPELLSSCIALFYNPADPRYQHFAGYQARVPIFNNIIPILPDELVFMDKGTGLVMCSTFGDKTDIEWFKKHSLPYRPSIGLDGKWLASTGILAGLSVTQARQTIVAALESQGFIKQQKPITHSVNIHERCKQPIEYLLLSQWFLKILPYKQQFITQAEKIQWFPAYMKTRYINWVENISWDWCLSRQRFYGIPFPAWHCLDCKTIIVPNEDQLPLDPQEATPPKNCPECKSAHIQPDTDVMDTWNTSSLTPYIEYALVHHNETDCFHKTTQEMKPFLPMGMRPQAHDIIRTWAFYTIVKTWMHHTTIPWHDIVISGHVLSSEKEKISKSQANSPLQPENLLKTYAADAIRYWAATGTLGTDTAFSETQLTIGQKLLVKLWNAFRFIHEHIVDYKPQSTFEKQDAVHEWILHQATISYQKYQEAFECYEFSVALETSNHFFWHDFCDNYLELVKDYLFNPQNYTPEEISATKQTLYEVGLRILQLYAPFIPYITEKLYQLLYRVHEQESSVHITHFEKIQKTSISVTPSTQATLSESVVTIKLVIALVQEVRKLKTTQQLSLKTEIALLTLSGSAAKIQLLQSQEKLIKGITRAAHIIYTIETVATIIEQREEAWHIFVDVNAL
ncbi:MAG: valine--tRNA ligase [Candidatus Babeliaceae bacterium]